MQDKGKAVKSVDGDIADQVRPVVVALCSDMMTSVRIQDAVEQAGGQAAMIDEVGGATNALQVADTRFPVLILVDLAYQGEWATVVRRCKLRPHTRRIPIYAFGSHVNTSALQAARDAGVDHAWARSRMMDELEKVIDAHVNPPTRYPQGWDDELSLLAKSGVEEFNRGEYFEQHELFEEAWMAEPRPIREMYQGILQIGVAFYHIEQGNWAGSLKLFRRGLPKLRHLPEVCQGVRIGEFRRHAERIYLEALDLGADGLKNIDTKRFPIIELVQ